MVLLLQFAVGSILSRAVLGLLVQSDKDNGTSSANGSTSEVSKHHFPNFEDASSVGGQSYESASSEPTASLSSISTLEFLSSEPSESTTPIDISSQVDNESSVFGVSSQVDTNPESSQTPLPVGVNELFIACRSGDVGVVKNLFDKHPDLDVNFSVKVGKSSTSKVHNVDMVFPGDEDGGATPLIVASDRGHAEVVRFLLTRKPIDVNYWDSVGMDALMYSSMYGNVEVVQSLLSHPDIEVNGEDNFGHSALVYACMANYSAVVRLLLAHPDIEVDSTTISMASKNGADRWQGGETVQLLKEHMEKQEGKNVEMVFDFLVSQIFAFGL